MPSTKITTSCSGRTLLAVCRFCWRPWMGYLLSTSQQRQLDIFGPRILPSDHLVASFVAYDHESRRMIISISPLNDLTTISWGRHSHIVLPSTPACSLPECADNSLIVFRRLLLQSDSDFASLALSFDTICYVGYGSPLW